MTEAEHLRADIALVLVVALVALAGFMGWLS